MRSCDSCRNQRCIVFLLGEQRELYVICKDITNRKRNQFPKYKEHYTLFYGYNQAQTDLRYLKRLGNSEVQNCSVSCIIMALGSNSLNMMQDDILEVEISIEPQFHGYFYANRQALLHQISMECGGVEILFPHASFDSDLVLIRGTLECINAAEKRMLQSIREMESRVTLECEIPRRHRRVVIGPKGCNLQRIGSEFNVRIKFPDRFTRVWRSDKTCDDEEIEMVETVPTHDVVQVKGKQHNAEAARQALLSLVPITVKVDVPFYLHRLIKGDRGSDIIELREKFGVGIALSRVEDELDYITITGHQPCVEKAKIAILKKCKILEAQQEEKGLPISFKLKIEVDSDYYPKIISYSGKAVHEIIADHDVAINFPCIGDPEDNIITISGSEENVYNARDDIMTIINELERENTIVLDEVTATQNQHPDISRCESSTLSIDAGITDCIGKTSQDLSKVEEEFCDAKHDIGGESLKNESKKFLLKMRMLYDKLKVSCNSIPLIEESTNLKSVTNSQEDLAEFFSNLILTQEEKITELKDHLNEQVSVNKALKVKRTRLILEIDSEKQECERMIRQNQQKYETEMVKISEAVDNINTKLNLEREEKLKIKAENDESSKRFEELDLKYKALQVTSTYFENQIEILKSRIKELEEKDTSQNTKLNVLECTNDPAFSDENSKQIHQS